MGNEASQGGPKGQGVLCIGCRKSISAKSSRYRKCAYLECNRVFCGDCKGDCMFKHGKGQYFCGDHHFAMTGEGKPAGTPMSTKSSVDTPQGQSHQRSIVQSNSTSSSGSNGSSNQGYQKKPPSARAAPTKRGKPPTPAMTPGTQEIYRTQNSNGGNKRTDRGTTPSNMNMPNGATSEDFADAFADNMYPASNSDSAQIPYHDQGYPQHSQHGQQQQQFHPSHPHSQHPHYMGPGQQQQQQQQQQQHAPNEHGQAQFMAMPPSGPPLSVAHGGTMGPGQMPRRSSNATSQKAAHLLDSEGQTASPNTAQRAQEAAREAAMAMSRSFGGYSQGAGGTTSINSVDLLTKMLETKGDAGLMIHGDLDTSNDGRTVRPKYWTAEEDEKLRKAVEQYGPRHWKDIATFVPGRTHVQCLQRWNKVLKPGLRKGAWTEEEDVTLTQLVETSDDQPNWSDIAEHIPGRSAKQCRERWSFNLDPSINKGEWSPEEDKILLEQQVKLGNKWSQIALSLPGRTENAIKTRHKSIIRAKKREWRPSEDALLLSYQRDFGNRWDEIASRLTNRTKNAVKMRFKFLTEDNFSATTKKSEAKKSDIETAKPPSSASTGTSPAIRAANAGTGELGTSNMAAAAANAKAGEDEAASGGSSNGAVGVDEGASSVKVEEGSSQASSSSARSESKSQDSAVGAGTTNSNSTESGARDKDTASVSTRTSATEDVLKRRTILQRTGACQSSKAAASSKEARARARKAAAAAVAAAEAAAREVSERQAAQMQQQQHMHPHMMHPNMPHMVGHPHMMHPQMGPVMHGHHMYPPYAMPQGYPPQGAYPGAGYMYPPGPQQQQQQYPPYVPNGNEGAADGHMNAHAPGPAPNFRPSQTNAHHGGSSNGTHVSSVDVVSMGTLGSTAGSAAKREVRGTNNKDSKVMLSEMLEDLANMDFDPLDENSRGMDGVGDFAADDDGKIADDDNANDFSGAFGYGGLDDMGRTDSSGANAYNSAFDGLNLDDLA